MFQFLSLSFSQSFSLPVSQYLSLSVSHLSFSISQSLGLAVSVSHLILLVSQSPSLSFSERLRDSLLVSQSLSLSVFKTAVYQMAVLERPFWERSF